MSSADVRDLRNTVFLEQEFSSRIRTDKLRFGRGHVMIALYSASKIALSVDLDGPGILVASNTYSPYWKCKVDGAEEDIFPADGAFWGVYIEKGWHEVVFEYRPPYRFFF